MPVIYHGAPRDMVRSVLYPLNQLQAIAPDQYAFQKAKYAGREAVLDYRIPGLGLLFNDTVHCSALHPYYLFRARQELGLDPPVRPTSGWLTGMVYAIPLERILIHRVVWYSCKTLWINGSPDDDVSLEPPAEEFEQFDPSRYQELSAPTERHFAHLATMRERGRRPLMFVHIPHVLVAGPIAQRAEGTGRRATAKRSTSERVMPTTGKSDRFSVWERKRPERHYLSWLFHTPKDAVGGGIVSG